MARKATPWSLNSVGQLDQPRTHTAWPAGIRCPRRPRRRPCCRQSRLSETSLPRKSRAVKLSIFLPTGDASSAAAWRRHAVASAASSVNSDSERSCPSFHPPSFSEVRSCCDGNTSPSRRSLRSDSTFPSLGRLHAQIAQKRPRQLLGQLFAGQLNLARAASPRTSSPDRACRTPAASRNRRPTPDRDG